MGDLGGYLLLNCIADLCLLNVDLRPELLLPYRFIKSLSLLVSYIQKSYKVHTELLLLLLLTSLSKPSLGVAYYHQIDLLVGTSISC